MSYDQAPEHTATRIDASFNMAAFGDGDELWRVGKKAAGRFLDGREWDEFPDDPPSILKEIADIAANLPEEAIAGIPRDGATNLDHYLYGAPKREPEF